VSEHTAFSHEIHDSINYRPMPKIIVSDVRQNWRFEMDGSNPCGLSGSCKSASPKRTRPGLRMSCSPSPQPSPPGEGGTFARALVIGQSLAVVCLRNESQRSVDCNCNVRIFRHRANGLPLLGERVRVRGNEANSNPRRTRTPGTLKLRQSHWRVGGFSI